MFSGLSCPTDLLGLTCSTSKEDFGIYTSYLPEFTCRDDGLRASWILLHICYQHLLENYGSDVVAAETTITHFFILFFQSEKMFPILHL